MSISRLPNQNVPWHHADDSGVASVQRDGRSDDLVSAAEPRFPEALRDDGDGLGAGLGVTRGDQPCRLERKVGVELLADLGVAIAAPQASHGSASSS